MKRDMDLVRKILIATEENEDPFGFDNLDDIGIKGYSDSQISYHVQIMAQANLIEADQATGFGDLNMWPIGLTWEGHEFLDNARDEKRWGKAKGIMVQVGSFSFDILKAVLIEMAKKAALGMVS